MRTQNLSRALVVAGTIAMATPALAGGISAKPGVYDPNNTGSVSASWATKEGLPDAGKSDHALVLVKAAPNPTDAAAGATIEGAEGQPADTPYGFDIRADSYHSGGAPRFNLLTEQGTFHFIGGADNGTVIGTFTDRQGRLWYRIVFDPTDPAQAFPVVPAGSTIAYLEVIVDEDTRTAPSGAAIIDNLLVDFTYIGKPGNAK